MGCQQAVQTRFSIEAVRSSRSRRRPPTCRSPLRLPKFHQITQHEGTHCREHHFDSFRALEKRAYAPIIEGMRSRHREVSRRCLMQRTRRAARVLSASYEAAFCDLGLTAGQFSTLIAVSVAGSESVSTLADELGMDRTTLSRALGPLRRRGLVRDCRHSEDSRRRLVTLTEEGRRVLEKAIPRWEAAQAEAEKQLAADELATLVRALCVLGQK